MADGRTITLTEAEARYIEGAVFDALFEVKRQRNEARSMTRQHEAHGETCCFGAARIEWQRDVASALDEKYQALKTVIIKLGLEESPSAADG